MANTYTVFDRKVKRQGKPFTKPEVPVSYDFPEIIDSLSNEQKDMLVKKVIDDYIKSNYDALTAAYEETQNYINRVKKFAKRYGKIEWTEEELHAAVNDYVNDLNEESKEALAESDKASFQPLRVQFEPFTKFEFKSNHLIEWADTPDTRFVATEVVTPIIVDPNAPVAEASTNGEQPTTNTEEVSIESDSNESRRGGRRGNR